jgi:type VI secretion system lysozyme-like protein
MSIDQTADLVPSLIDRLTTRDEPAQIGSRQESELTEASIIRDLEMLLNTRREEFLVPAEFEETSASIVNFGIPDIAKCGSLRSGPEQVKLCRWIEEAIRNFEPRLRNITVRVIDRENVSPLLRFRIEAKAEFSSGRMVFDLGLKRDTGELAIFQGSSR